MKLASHVTRRGTLSALGAAILTVIGSRGGTAVDSARSADGNPADMTGRRRQLAEVRKWGCQFQNTDIGRIAASPLDMIVVDHALDQPGRVVATAAEIERLKTKPDGSRRLVLAYLSVGEAENYRPYWNSNWANDPPAWLGPSNVNWPGSYVARYWEPDWQKIVFSGDESILAGILAAGFDGVFLDRVDAYIDWEATRPAAPAEMVELVRRLAATARAADPHFLIISQNAEPLLRRKAYRDLIDGVSKESLLYGLAAPGTPNTEQDIAWSMTGLNAAHGDAIPIFAIEYLDDPKKMKVAAVRLATHGFKPFFANRALDRLPDDPPGID